MPFLAALVGVLVIIPATSASVSVEPTDPVAVTNEGPSYIAISLRVVNEGKTRVYGIRYHCEISHLEYGHNGEIANVTINARDSGEIDSLDPRRKIDTTCAGKLWEPISVDPKTNPLESAEMSFYVSYKPRWRLGRKTEEFRFEGVREPDGRFRWFTRPPGTSE